MLRLLVEEVQQKTGAKSGKPYYRVKTSDGMWRSAFDGSVMGMAGSTCDIVLNPQKPDVIAKITKVSGGGSAPAGGDGSLGLRDKLMLLSYAKDLVCAGKYENLGAAFADLVAILEEEPDPTVDQTEPEPF